MSQDSKSSLRNSISCIVPAKNEEGSLRHVIAEILDIKQISQIIIVEGGSKDNTSVVAQKIALENKNKIILVQQESTGKFNAVSEALKHSTQDMILIWDADGTVPKEDTLKIIEIAHKKQISVMGDRLRGSIQHGAMQSANWVGNHFFSIMWAPLMSFRKLDLLCGTKIFIKSDFEKIPKVLLRIDPYGDFSMIASSIFQKKELISIPVNYNKRNYGKTNIKRWRGGLRLLLTTATVYFIFPWVRMNLKIRNKFNG